MSENPVVLFERGDAVSLAHAMSGYVARQNDIRALSIKGFTFAHHNLRRPRNYADADIWIEPEHISKFVSLLEERGWTERYSRYVPHVLSDHSVTLIHPRWPCDIDVHWYFPGCFQHEIDVFERLWVERERVFVANIEVVMPNFEASALLGLLHARRHPDSSAHQAELARVIEAIRERSSESKRRFASLVSDVDASGAIGEEVLNSVGAGEEYYPRDVAKLDEWHLHVESLKDGTTTLSWLNAVRRAPARRRLRLLWEALYPGHHDLERQERKPLTRIAAWRVRLSRAYRGIRTTPHAVLFLITRRSRSGRSHTLRK